MTLTSTHRPPADLEVAGAALPWMVRTNPLVRHRLGDPELRDLLDQLVRAEREITRLAEIATDALYERIGEAGGQRRSELVALRRSVHNDRDPAPRLLEDDVPGLDAWLAARRRRDALAERVGGAADSAAARERLAVARLLSQDGFRRATALVAPQIHAATSRYLAAVEDHGRPSSRIRKSERGLLQYLTRAMVRTSPLSRFTAVGLVSPSGPAAAEPDPAAAVSFYGLDRVMLDFVLGGLHVQEVTGATLVQVPPTAQADPSGVLYFLRHDGTGMRRLSVPLSGVVQMIYEAVAMGPRSLDEVVAHVAFRAGSEPAKAETAVRAAVDAGILCTRALPEDGGVDVPDLLAHRPTAHADLLEGLGRQLASTDHVPTEDLPDHVGTLRTRLDELARAAGRAGAIVVEEDHVLPPTSLEPQAWGPALTDLGAAVELESVFDRMHDVRALLLTAFVEQHGRGASVSLCAAAQGLADRVYEFGGAEDGVIAAGSGPADGSLGQLHRLREEVVDALGAGLDRAVATGESLRWSAEEARSLVAATPERFRRLPQHYGVLVQRAEGAVVLNDAYAGHGMLLGRFLAADRALGGDALTATRDWLLRTFDEPGGRATEDVGLHRLNVNGHTTVLSQTMSPADWFGLSLAHRPETDDLVLRRPDGREVTVLTLGAGHPELYPAPLRIATWLYTAGRLYPDLPGLWLDRRGRGTEGTLAVPRIQVGEAVLSRRRWYAGTAFADALGQPDELDRMVALARWRAAVGAPAELVLKTPLDDAYRRQADASQEPREQHRRRQKPQYVDLDSAVMVRSLPRLIGRRAGGYLEEALPGVEAGPHATEWVVPVGREAHGRFTVGGLR